MTPVVRPDLRDFLPFVENVPPEAGELAWAVAQLAADRGYRAVDEVRARALEADEPLQRPDTVFRVRTAVEVARLDDRVASLRAVLVGEHVVVREDQRVAAGLVANERAERAGRHADVANRAADAERPVSPKMPRQRALDDLSDVADVDLPAGVALDGLQLAALLHGAPLDTHGEAEVVASPRGHAEGDRAVKARRRFGDASGGDVE